MTTSEVTSTSRGVECPKGAGAGCTTGAHGVKAATTRGEQGEARFTAQLRARARARDPVRSLGGGERAGRSEQGGSLLILTWLCRREGILGPRQRRVEGARARERAWRGGGGCARADGVP